MSPSEMFVMFGGIGMFLYGMTIMSTGLRNACGEHLQSILEKATRSRLTSVGVGIGLTVLMQSSSATDVMVIGFVTSGLMTLTQALGVIMGANIGTTVTAQITAFNIGMYAPVILFVGAIMTLFVKKQTLRDIGSVILGFGMLFVGLSMIKQSIAPLAETPLFIRLISGLENPFATILFGVLFTALLQSSSSSTVIFQAFAVEGLISYQTAVWLVIGAAVGSVMPNLLAGLTANRAGKRCSVLNLLFNLLRAALIVTLITVFPQILTFLQATAPGNIARQIANTHTAFAIIAVVILLPFSNQIVALSEKLIPLSADENKIQEERRLVYLTNIERIPPAMVIDQAHREVSRMGHIAADNLADAVDCFQEPSERKQEEVLSTEKTVDYLTKAILDQLVQVRMDELTPRLTTKLYDMIRVVDDIERISDHAQNIVEYSEVMRSGKAKLSEDGMRDLRELSDLAVSSVRLSVEVFETEDVSRIGEARKLEEQVDLAKERVLDNHAARLARDKCDPQGGIILTDMATDLERCSDHGMNLVDVVENG